MMKLDRLISSATDFARSMSGRGFRVVGTDAVEKVSDLDVGAVSLALITEAMVATQGWDALKKVLQARREMIWRGLSTCTEAELKALQVEARVIDEVIQLPEKWIVEGREAAQRIAQAREKGVE
jgi:hypothetical protein